MRTTEITDFSGGLREVVSPGDFSGRQLSVCRGFVAESEVELRSQHGLQQVTDRSDWVWVESFRGELHAWLVALADDGSLWCSRKENPTFWQQSVADTFSRFGTGAERSWRPCGEHSYKVGDEYRNSLFISGVETADAPKPASNLIIYENDGGTLTFVTKTSFYPQLTGDPQEPVSGVFPRCAGGGMWKDFSVLFDIEWSAANAETGLTEANTERYRNYLWMSDPTDSTKYDPRYPVRVAEDGAAVVGVQEVEDGLLVFTSSSTGDAGLVMLRGNPANFILETLEPGLGLPSSAARQTTNARHTYWAAISSAVFEDADGKVWQVRNGQLGRLDRYGAALPHSPGDFDQVCAAGDFLFLSRAGRWLVMRAFGEDGAWYELVPPGPAPTSMTVCAGDLYLVSGGKLWRYLLTRPDHARGCVNADAVDLVLATESLGDPNEYRERFWDAVAVRLEGVSAAPKLVSLGSFDGSLLLNPAPDGYEVSLDEPVQARSLHSVDGYGNGRECCVRLVARFDVRVENIAVTWEYGSEVW